MSLAGRTVLATGAGCGIGAAIERVFAERGASVAVNDVDQAAAGRTVGEIAASSFITGATLDVKGGLLMR